MSSSVFYVPARSWAEIAGIAAQQRKSLGLQNVARFPIIEFLEEVLDNMFKDVLFLLGTKEEMGNAEGFTCPQGRFIQLREDVYEAAVNGNGRARFTAAHEAGHYFLHARGPMTRGEPGSIRPYNNSERQADQFAAELLMPAEFFLSSDDIDLVMYRHGVSRSAAANRLNYLKGRNMI